MSSKSINDLLKFATLVTDMDDVQSELEDFGEQLSYMQGMVEPSANSPSLCAVSNKRQKMDEATFDNSVENIAQHLTNTHPMEPLDLKLKERVYSEDNRACDTTSLTVHQVP